MSRNANWNSRQMTGKKAIRLLRPVHGRPVVIDEVAGVQKFKNDRRQARLEWRKEDERYDE